MNSTDDILLFKLIQSGDEHAFKYLFDTYFASLCRYMNLYLDNTQEAEERDSRRHANLHQDSRRTDNESAETDQGVLGRRIYIPFLKIVARAIRVVPLFCVILMKRGKLMRNKEKNIPWNLIIAKLRQEIAKDDEQQLEEWLHKEANREVFEELQLVWTKVQQNASDYTPDTPYYWKELSARMKRVERKPVARTLFSKHLRRYAAVACVALLAAFSFTFYVGLTAGKSQIVEQSYSNLSGKSKVQLPDNTEVWLHAKSELSYKSSFHKSNDRVVALSGEAFFEVTPNKGERFVVETDGMRIIVHGTKFNVESFASSDHTLVSLVEGSVALETTAGSSFLRPGEMATYNKKSHQLRIEKADVLYSSSWANEKMIFTNKSLGHICRFLSKWYNVKINLDPALENKYMYTFTLRNEPLEEILRLMSRINPTEYHFDDENELTLFAKPIK